MIMFIRIAHILVRSSGGVVIELPTVSLCWMASLIIWQKKYYRQIYDKHFKFDTIIKRKLPEWTSRKETSENILGMS